MFYSQVPVFIHIVKGPFDQSDLKNKRQSVSDSVAAINQSPFWTSFLV